MKCFKCGALCHTNYIYDYVKGKAGMQIVAVSKLCPSDECGWESYPTKLPEKIT